MNRSDEAHEDFSMIASQRSTAELSLIELATIMLRNRRLFVLIPFLLFVLVVTATLFEARTFTSTLTFVPAAPDAASSRAIGLASQFGITLPLAGGALTPDFYADLVKARPILMSVVESDFEGIEVPRSLRSWDAMPPQGTLVEILEIDEDSPALARELALREAEDLVSVSLNRATGQVRVGVSTKSPELSRQIATRLLDAVVAFNLETRRSRASSERAFTDERREAARQELIESENALQAFLRANRIIQSPELQMEQDRLQRGVAMRQQVYTSLAQAYEQARIEEVRDTPVLTVVQTPEAAVIPDRRWLIVKAFLALVVGFIVALALAFFREFQLRVRSPARGDPVEEFGHEWHATRQGIRRLVQGRRPVR